MPGFKRPESVLVVIYATDTQRVLMLQRNDDSDFWQSVSGSLEQGETALCAAKREVAEETGLSALGLVDCQKAIDFEIFPQFRYKYAPNITHCHEHWFLLPLADECEVRLSEHSAYCWVTAEQAVTMTKSWNNAAAIEQFLLTT
ncbi:dihydroneopterin triphosphate diphosphatase [Testudinibacter aquarius]|uniref:Dihydroneopterin triphosphate diphosphatase n=1 Tax=Testudinibacter aquarius TaxID=1524974 RepID=A0A4R3Y461_9PAST|nr:dihydroneopterin triphosphate diphosphatase [Testudinibacter aquarius]KAE9528011.1 dihydroneopterin triphosphate diphosphatase [Testudinibacter aquarius]TCV86467.1 dihydroneopterin triphosphate pyrophosphatase [Testudinibacter aquarius]TNG90218.1 dihydroneopterin triphosphate diphosphatase [Testudinibacter aquarius]